MSIVSNAGWPTSKAFPFTLIPRLVVGTTRDASGKIVEGFNILHPYKKSGRTLSVKRETGRRLRSGRRRIILALLLDVAVFDLLHEGFALEEVGLEARRELAGDDEELIVDHLGDGDGAAGGNQVCAPLEHEAGVPKDEEGQDGGYRGESRSAGVEDSSEALQENAEAKNEERRQRDKKTVAVGRDAGPVRITGDEEVKGEEGGEQRSANARLVPAEENQSGNGEKKDGSPDKQAVVG